MNHTQCTNCDCHYNEIEFARHCSPPYETDLYHFASALLTEGVAYEMRNCAGCGGPVVMMYPLTKKEV
jgi:hypothetical protein